MSDCSTKAWIAPSGYDRLRLTIDRAEASHACGDDAAEAEELRRAAGYLVDIAAERKVDLGANRTRLPRAMPAPLPEAHSTARCDGRSGRARRFRLYEAEDGEWIHITSGKAPQIASRAGVSVVTIYKAARSGNPFGLGRWRVEELNTPAF